MCYYRSILILCCMLSLGEASKPPQHSNPDAVKTNFTITYAGTNITCSQTINNLNHVTVREDESFQLETIFVKPDGPKTVSLDYFECSVERNSVKIDGSTKGYYNNILKIQNVTSNMAGIWKCRIQAYKNTRIKPSTQCLKESKAPCAVAYCYVQLHIRLKETPQTVLVNNMIVATSPTSYADTKIDHVAEYKFLEGDVVNVLCVPRNDIIEKITHYITLQYDYAAGLSDMFKNQMQKPSEMGYGFRTKLQNVHHNTTMVCNCTGPQDFTTVQVKFLLLAPSEIENYEHIEINGLIGRKPKGVDFNYLSFEGDKVDIVCHTNRSDLSVVFEEDCNSADTNKTLSRITTSISKEEKEKFCSKCRQNEVLEKITVRLLPWSLAFKETVDFKVDLPENNNKMELYNSRSTYDRHSWIYYEFNEGDVVKPICTAKNLMSSTPSVKYKIFNTRDGNLTQHLTSEKDNTLFECEVSESGSVENYKTITVQFHKKMITTTSSTTPTTEQTAPVQSSSANTGGFPEWAPPVIGVLMCIILACVFIAVYKMKKRNRKNETGNVNQENLHDHNHNVSITPYPQQRSQNEEGTDSKELQYDALWELYTEIPE